MKIDVTQELDVTQEHINKGRKSICSYCPVALALQEHFPDAWVGMDIGNIALMFIKKVPEREDAYIDDKVSQFVTNFDRGLPVEPFSFELNLENISQ